MDINSLHRVYFLGIGGIGMSALARYFNSKGITVAGYDKTPTALTKQLLSEGIKIHFDDDINQILTTPDLVIYTPAIPNQLEEYVYIRESGIPLIKRAEILGKITEGEPTIAIAGTHGKTTITSMIAHLLYQSEVGCTALIGGILNKYQTNFLSSVNGNYHVVEADEYDRSFLQLNPNLAIITAMDTDHLDIYLNTNQLRNSFYEFAAKVQKGGHLLINKGLEIPSANPNISFHIYGIYGPAEYFADNIRIQGRTSTFNLHFGQKLIEDLELNMPGRMNVENAVAASAAALLAGISEQELRVGLKSFNGIHRRFDYLLDNKKMVYIDDYAHHPAEIDALVTSVRQLYPGKQICGIFQPHLYSRTRDLALDFANALSNLDEVILLPIYPAREKPIPGIDSNTILNQMTISKKSQIEKEHLLQQINEKYFDVLLTIGAGDIDQFREPLKELLSHNLKTIVK